MSVVSVRARSFILALFIRDDGERFLLGDRGFDFKDSQLHFSANTIENDEVEKQGVDGVMLAGQVRRASVQSFDGYVGDGSTLKEEVEQMRRDFIAFFAKGHHFRVIYIDCNRNAWQRKGGYLVDAPEVKELWQIHPEYHVGLNFEDVNYYEYDENAEGEEILSNIISVPISSDVEGGLVWDENGAVSEPEEIEYDTETATASGTNISIADAVEAPLKSLEIQGNTTQQAYTGKNLFNYNEIAGKTYTPSSINCTVAGDGTITLSGNTLANGYMKIESVPLKTFAPKLEVGKTYYMYLVGSNLARQHMYIYGDAVEWANGTAHTITQTDLDNDIVFYGGYNTTTTFKIMITTTADANWEKFVGGTPAPNPDYPQAVNTVTGENVVKINGKNLFDKSKATLGYRIAGDGTPYADSPYFISDFIPVKASTAYHINTANVGGSSAIATYDKNKVFIRRILGDGYQNIVTDANALYIRFATSQTVIDQAQLELGSTATAYEPYQGQSYEVNLGKNMFTFGSSDISGTKTGITYSYNATTQEWTFNGTATSQTEISYPSGAGIDMHLNSGVGYTTTGFYQSGTIANGSVSLFQQDGIHGWQGIAVTMASAANNSESFTPNTNLVLNDAHIIRIANGTTLSNFKVKFQTEKGSHATSYAAYFEPIELCKIGTYQDSIYKSDGKWYVRKETGKRTYTADDITIAASDAYSNVRYAQFPKGADNKQYGNYTYGDIINFFTHGINMGAVPAGGWNSYISDGLIYNSAMQDNYWCSFAKSTVLATMKEKLNGMVAYYVLATPTDTEITNQALVAQLEAILDGGTSAGTNNITTIISAGNAQGELEITYYTKYDAKVVGGGYVWEAGGSGGPTIVTNESISAVSPVWTVFGPALNPMLENTTTGEQIQYVDMISEGQTLVVDMGEQTASLDGLNVISNIVGEYLTLAPGSNTLLFSADSDAPASEIGWSEIVG